MYLSRPRPKPPPSDSRASYNDVGGLKRLCSHARELCIRAYHDTATLLTWPEMMPVFLPYAVIPSPRLGYKLPLSPWELERPLCHPIPAVKPWYLLSHRATALSAPPHRIVPPRELQTIKKKKILRNIYSFAKQDSIIYIMW